jgi:hypothetical protein
VWSGPSQSERFTQTEFLANSCNADSLCQRLPCSDVLLRERSMLVTAHDCFTDSGRDSLANGITPSTVPQLKAGVHAPSMGDVITLQYYMVGISSYVMVFGTRYITVYRCHVYYF